MFVQCNILHKSGFYVCHVTLVGMYVRYMLRQSVKLCELFSLISVWMVTKVGNYLLQTKNLVFSKNVHVFEKNLILVY